MARKNSIGVFSLDRAVDGPLAVGVVVQPWMVLVRPPVDALAELGEGVPNGSLRVLVAPLDRPLDAVTGSVVFNDPLDRGLLAAVQLDRDMSWRTHPVRFLDPEDEDAAVDDVHHHLGLRTSRAAAERRTAADRAGGAGLPGGSDGTTLPGAPDWPPEVPPTWPPGRSWPPAGDPASHRGICSVIPCCWGCPKNPKC